VGAELIHSEMAELLDRQTSNN